MTGEEFIQKGDDERAKRTKEHRVKMTGLYKKWKLGEDHELKFRGGEG